jgi:hypothetical protein
MIACQGDNSAQLGDPPTMNLVGKIEIVTEKGRKCAIVAVCCCLLAEAGICKELVGNKLRFT